MGELATGKIVQVEYRELVTGPGYNNTTIGVIATVQEGVAPDRTLAECEGWVRYQFGRRNKEREDLSVLRRERSQLLHEHEQLNREIAARRLELELLRGPRARMVVWKDRFARRFPRLAPRGWRELTDDDLDDVPF